MLTMFSFIHVSSANILFSKTLFREKDAEAVTGDVLRVVLPG